MANFSFAFAFFSKHEWNQRRNFTDTPGDPGGPTNFGITLRSWQSQGSLGDLDHDGDVDQDDLKLVDNPVAEHFYLTRYWRKGDDRTGIVYFDFGQINDDRVAAKVCDIGVNLGPDTAIRYLQEALQAVGFPSIVVDGLWGRQTVAATNSSSPDRLIAELCHLQRVHYIYWVQAKPAERQKFASGLLARAGDVPTLSQGASA
jgi:lysozyme family protein